MRGLPRDENTGRHDVSEPGDAKGRYLLRLPRESCGVTTTLSSGERDLPELSRCAQQRPPDAFASRSRQTSRASLRRAVSAATTWNPVSCFREFPWRNILVQPEKVSGIVVRLHCDQSIPSFPISFRHAILFIATHEIHVHTRLHGRPQFLKESANPRDIA